MNPTDATITFDDGIRPLETIANRDQLVLVFAPTGNDAHLAADFFAKNFIEAKVCRSMSEVVRESVQGCGALLLADEIIELGTAPLLGAALAQQPSWSDLPILLATSASDSRASGPARLAAFGENANLTLLERPFRPTTLVRAVEVALRTRRRQYQVRDLLAELEKSSGRIRRILEQTIVGIAETDLTGRFTLVNDRYCKIVRRSREELLNLHIRDLVYGDDVEESVRRFQELVAGQTSSYVIEKRYIDPDGAAVWVQDHVTAIRDHDGIVCGVTLASADITERKISEEAAMRARDEAVAASRAKDDFLAALSHELRTPLNPVLLLASEGEQNPDYSVEVRADFETIARNASLEARLIDDLLDLTRITQKKLTLESQPHNLHAILSDALATIKADVHDRAIHLTIDCAPAAPIIIGDPMRLQQVFWNVLKNAVKFTPPGGSINVTTRIDDAPARAVVSITDSGFGMNEAELARIFQAFTQGDHARKPGAHNFGGLGLGLAISKTLIDLHHGTITASSPGRGHGSTFVIELPIVAASVINSKSSLEPSSAALTGESAVNLGPRILLVEDHAPTRITLTTLLSRRRFAVFPASSVGHALDIAAHEEIDLVVSDIGLPDGSGNDLMRELRAKYGLRGIALTGYGMEQDIAESRSAGFVAHLTKPVDVRSLDKTLSEFRGTFAFRTPPGLAETRSVNVPAG